MTEEQIWEALFTAWLMEVLYIHDEWLYKYG